MEIHTKSQILVTLCKMPTKEVSDLNLGSMCYAWIVLLQSYSSLGWAFDILTSQTGALSAIPRISHRISSSRSELIILSNKFIIA